MPHARTRIDTIAAPTREPHWTPAARGRPPRQHEIRAPAFHEAFGIGNVGRKGERVPAATRPRRGGDCDDSGEEVVVSEAEESGSRTAARRRPAPLTRPEIHPRSGGGGSEESPAAEEAMSAQRREDKGDEGVLACWAAVALRKRG
jgi:hypothetical protein